MRCALWCGVARRDPTEAPRRGASVLVTALNSAPVIFYPTDTFAELEPRFFSGRQLCTQYTMAAYPLRIIHIVGIVAEW
jgi:hypothetical protein